MPEAVTKWKDASGAVHDTFGDCVIGEIACLIGKVGTGDASFATAIARKIVEKAEEIIDQLTFLKERMDENPAEKEQLRKLLGLPEPDRAQDQAVCPCPMEQEAA